MFIHDDKVFVWTIHLQVANFLANFTVIGKKNTEKKGKIRYFWLNFQNKRRLSLYLILNRVWLKRVKKGKLKRGKISEILMIEFRQ